MQSGQTKYGIGMTVSACLWLGLFPLLQFGSFHTLTREKWICMLILTGVTGICFLSDALSRRLSRPRPLPLLFAGGLLLWIVLSCLFSPFSGTPWWIGTGRREGLASWLCYLALFFLFVCSKVRRKAVLTAAACSVPVFLSVVLLQRAGSNPFGLYPEGTAWEDAPEFLGTLGNVDMCSAYLAILCGLFLPEIVDSMQSLIRESRSLNPHSPSEETVPGRPLRIAYLCLLLVSLFAAVYLLLTVHVASGLLALGVVIVVTLVRLLPKKARLPVLVLLLAAALLLVWFWQGAESGSLWELHEILHGRPQYAFGSGRVGVLARTRTMLQTEGHLLLGTGADTFARRFNAFLLTRQMLYPDEPVLTGYYDSPHCEYLALVSNCGIPALLFYLALVFAGCLGAVPWRGGVLACSIHLFFSFSVCLIVPMFWVVLGLSVAFPTSKNRNAVSIPAE